MPTYDLINNKTGDTVSMLISISEKEKMVESGDWTQVVSAPNTVSQVGSNLSRTSSAWRDHLKSIKKTSGRTNTIKL